MQPELTGLDPKWLIEQGPLVVLFVLVLYFYRRDFKNAASSQTQNITAMLDLVKMSVASSVENKALLQQILEKMDERPRR